MQLNSTDFLTLLKRALFYVLIINIILIAGSYFQMSIADKSLSDTFISIVKNTKTSVVNIHTTRIVEKNTQNKGFRIKGQGSGVIYSENGFIITNKHVIKNAGEIIVRLFDEREFKAEVIGTDERSGIAVIKVDAEDLTPAILGNSDSLELGEIILAIGNPLGLGLSVTSGIISAKGTSEVQITGFEDFLQTDATLNPDSYGGPLVNLDREIVGISTVLPTQMTGFFGISLAIPINVVKKATEDLIKYGKITRGWLGVTAQPVTTELQNILGLKNNQGALVSDVEPDSAAENAGIKSGDVIIKYNGKKIKNILLLRSLVKGTEINKNVEIVVIRDNKELTLNTAIKETSKAKDKSRENLFKNLGMTVENITGKESIHLGFEAEKGVILTNVQKDSPAYDAGLSKGDIIIEVQHKPVTSIDELYQAILKIKQEEDILMFIKRQNKSSKFIVVKQKKEV